MKAWLGFLDMVLSTIGACLLADWVGLWPGLGAGAWWALCTWAAKRDAKAEAALVEAMNIDFAKTSSSVTAGVDVGEPAWRRPTQGENSERS